MPTCRSPPGFADGHNGADGARNAQGGWKRHAAAGAQAARISLAAAAAAAAAGAFLPFVLGREEGGTAPARDGACRRACVWCTISLMARLPIA